MTPEIQTSLKHVHAGGGICGTCLRPAEASRQNEGYSDCCNDRIEYGSEAVTALNDEAAGF